MGSIMLTRVQKFFWALFFLTLPFTSFPFLPPAVGGGALVRPLSLYPLAALMVLVTLPRLWKRPLPKTLLALIPFVLIAVASGLISLFAGIEPSLGVSVFDRVLRALLTLGIGCAIYVTVALLPETIEDLRFSLRWLYTGFTLAIFWGTLQAVYIIRWNQEWFQLLNRLQRYISIRRLFNNRISGTTYEPNWFAEQLTFLLLPWLLASVLTGQTVFRWRWRWITGELLLLIWTVALLPFTFSRAGVLNLVVLAFVSVLVFRPAKKKDPAEQARVRVPLLRRLIEAGLAIAVVASLVFFAGTKNEFFARIWSYWDLKKSPSLSDYLEYLGFGARLTYSETAWNVYTAAPVFGVGPGNYAFYFEEKLPERPLAKTVEVLRLITPEQGRNRLVTPKNFYFRLLAETGLVGTAAFFAFLAANLGCALYLWLSPDRRIKFWGTAGLLGIVAFLFAAVSFDSFAIPNMWVIFGLITASAWVFRDPAQLETTEQTGKLNLDLPTQSGE